MQFTTSHSLLERLVAADQAIRDQSWNRFVYLYTPLLLVWARKQGFNESDAADLIQEVFLKLLKNLPDYRRRPESRFRSWLMILLRNQGQDFRRRKSTRKNPEAASIDSPSLDCFSELEDNEYHQWIINRGLSLVREEVSENTWRAFEGVMIRELPAAEVAVELDISVNAVYLARHRVLARLREILTGFLDED